MSGCASLCMTSSMLVSPTFSLVMERHTPKVSTAEANCKRRTAPLLFAVRFRFVVFRPFIDEVLVGKIRSCSSEGVRGA